MTSRERPWPVEVRLNRQAQMLEVRFDTGESFELSAEFLRVLSPSAEVRGHGVRPTHVVGGKRNVKIIDMKQIGNYAVRLIFDDGHDTGLYSWDYLLDLGRSKQKLWSEYIEQLSAQGGRRD